MKTFLNLIGNIVLILALIFAILYKLQVLGSVALLVFLSSLIVEFKKLDNKEIK